MGIVKPAEQVDMARNKRLLNRYRFIEYESLRILAAWLPARRPGPGSANGRGHQRAR